MNHDQKTRILMKIRCTPKQQLDRTIFTIQMDRRGRYERNALSFFGRETLDENTQQQKK